MYSIAFNFGPNLTLWQKIKALRSVPSMILRLRKFAKLHPVSPADRQAMKEYDRQARKEYESRQRLK
jgi:hypothetical protein